MYKNVDQMGAGSMKKESWNNCYRQFCAFAKDTCLKEYPVFDLEALDAKGVKDEKVTSE